MTQLLLETINDLQLNYLFWGYNFALEKSGNIQHARGPEIKKVIKYGEAKFTENI